MVNNRNEDEEFLTIPYMLLNQAKSHFHEADKDFLIAASKTPVFGMCEIIILKVKYVLRNAFFLRSMYRQFYNLLTKEKNHWETGQIRRSDLL